MHPDIKSAWAGSKEHLPILSQIIADFSTFLDKITFSKYSQRQTMESITIKGNVISLLAIIDFIKKWDMKVELSGTINDMDVKNELDENDKMMLFMGAFNGVFSDENIKEAKEFKAKDS